MNIPGLEVILPIPLALATGITIRLLTDLRNKYRKADTRTYAQRSFDNANELIKKAIEPEKSRITGKKKKKHRDRRGYNR